MTYPRDDSGVPDMEEWLTLTVKIISTYRQKLTDPVFKTHAEKSKINPLLKELKILLDAIETPDNKSAEFKTFGVQQR